MLCEHDRSALTEAAATGELAAALRAQLDSCASCRAAFADEQSLFATIDFGLRAEANAEIPPSLLPRLRLALDAQPAPSRAGLLGWACVVATAAMALLVLAARLHHPFVSDSVRSPSVSSARVSLREEPPPRGSEMARPASRQRVHYARLRPLQAGRSGPQVMVPPGEREAYLRFTAALQHQDELVRGLAVREPLETRDPPTAAEPLAIAELEIKLLDPGLEGSGRDRK